MTSEPLVLSYGPHAPAPRLGLRASARVRREEIPDPSPLIATGPPDRPFDFSAAMDQLCRDIVERSPALQHIVPDRLLFTIIKARNGQHHGLQARVTPLRFQGGALATLHRGRALQVQRILIDGREILYLVTFCIPRFLNREFTDKLVTIFHELYHINPAFDGDLRRHAGRYSAHTARQKNYDAHMAQLVRDYLAQGADYSRHAFLRLSFWQLCQRHGMVTGYHFPRPKLVPVPYLPRRSEY